MNKKLTITLKPWYYTCSDGCCSADGIDVKVDGVKVTEDGHLNYALLSSVLNHLNYDVEIYDLDENDEIVGEFKSNCD